MKANIIISIFLLGIISQSEVVGEYKRFGKNIVLNSDYTYEYNFFFDTYSEWSKGNWTIKKDTIYLQPILIYDTLRIAGKKDSILLSNTKKPNLIVSANMDDIIRPKSSGKQTNNIFKKLYIKNGKLFEIKKDGKLRVKKIRNWMSNKKEFYNPWFEKLK